MWLWKQDKKTKMIYFDLSVDSVFNIQNVIQVLWHLEWSLKSSTQLCYSISDSLVMSQSYLLSKEYLSKKNCKKKYWD